LPKYLSERIKEEEVCFWLFLFDLEGLGPLPTYPKEWDQNQVVHSQKLFLWVRLFLEFF